MSAHDSLLRNIEFSIIHFTLEFQEPIHLGLEMLLRLRRDLRQAGRHAFSGRLGSTAEGDPFRLLFDPPLSTDPLGVKRHQKPGPPFAMHFCRESVGEKHPGDTLDLPVVFWGDGIQRLADFARVLQTLGSAGLHRREGVFDLVAMTAEDAAGGRAEIWREGRSLDAVAPIILDGRWRAGELSPDFLRMRFITPARIVSDGKPLFHPDFQRIFPFVLRRVTSMCFIHCGVELVDNSGSFLKEALRVETRNNHLKWEDWRSLPGGDGGQDIGGILGSIDLRGPALREIGWVLSLGSLVNVGKGAAFGAGQFRLENR